MRPRARSLGAQRRAPAHRDVEQPPCGVHGHALRAVELRLGRGAVAEADGPRANAEEELPLVERKFPGRDTKRSARRAGEGRSELQRKLEQRESHAHATDGLNSHLEVGRDDAVVPGIAHEERLPLRVDRHLLEISHGLRFRGDAPPHPKLLKRQAAAGEARLAGVAERAGGGAGVLVAL